MKKNTVKELPQSVQKLLNQIPREQRKRIVKNKAYREGWLDSTMFWKLQLDETFEKWETKIKKSINT